MTSICDFKDIIFVFVLFSFFFHEILLRDMKRYDLITDFFMYLQVEFFNYLCLRIHLNLMQFRF